MALSLTIETEEGKIEKLHHALSREVAISEIAYNTFDKNSKKERRLLLNVNFSKGKGDLKIKIPEVPG